MSLVESLLGYRNLSSEPEIRQRIKRSRNYDASKESPDRAKSLLIFETSKQRTWLIATGERLYFVLDDVRKPGPRVSRSICRDDLQALPDGKISVSVQPKSSHTGLIDVGLEQRGWLYSRALFSHRPIEHAINELLTDTNGRGTAVANGKSPD